MTLSLDHPSHPYHAGQLQIAISDLKDFKRHVVRVTNGATEDSVVMDGKNFVALLAAEIRKGTTLWCDAGFNTDANKHMAYISYNSLVGLLSDRKVSENMYCFCGGITLLDTDGTVLRLRVNVALNDSGLLPI